MTPKRLRTVIGQDDDEQDLMKEHLHSSDDDGNQIHAVCAPELYSGRRTGGGDDDSGGHGATELDGVRSDQNI